MKKFTWHKIPHWLHWFFIVPAAFAWAFGASKILYFSGGRFCGRLYDLQYFYLMELSSGSWYIRLGSL